MNTDPSIINCSICSCEMKLNDDNFYYCQYESHDKIENIWYAYEFDGYEYWGSYVSRNKNDVIEYYGVGRYKKVKKVKLNQKPYTLGKFKYWIDDNKPTPLE